MFSPQHISWCVRAQTMSNGILNARYKFPLDKGRRRRMGTAACAATTMNNLSIRKRSYTAKRFV